MSFWQKPSRATAGIMVASNVAAVAVTVPSLMKDRETAEATKHFLFSDSILGKGIPNVVVLVVVAVLVEAVATALVYLAMSPKAALPPNHPIEEVEPLIDSNPDNRPNATTPATGFT